MHGTSLDLEDPPDLRVTVEHGRPTDRSGRHRLEARPGRHRRARRIAPLTVGALTMAVAATVAVVGQSGRATPNGPDLDAALAGSRASVVGGVSTPPSSTPETTAPTQTAVPTSSASSASPTSAPTSASTSATTSATTRRTTATSKTPAKPSASPSTPRRSPSAAAPSASGKLSGGVVQWSGDFDSGNTSQWDLETARNDSLRVLDGGTGHTTAGRFEVTDGDTPVDSGERSEAKPPDWTDVSEGDERWYSFSMMFDKSFPVPADGWCDPVQWHPANSDHSAAEGSPQLNLQCGNDGDDKLYLQVGDKDLLPIGTLDRGVWHRYLLHVKFSNDPGVAFEEVHRDGQLVLPKTSPRYANMTTPKAYLKIGMYRKGTNDGSMVVWHDGMTIYTSAPSQSTG